MNELEQLIELIDENNKLSKKEKMIFIDKIEASLEKIEYMKKEIAAFRYE